MGTSKSIGIGKGGLWTKVKRQITGHFSGSSRTGIGALVGGAVQAARGIGVGSRGGGGGGGGGSGGGGGGGGGGGRSTSRAAGKALGALGGLGLAAQEGRLNDALATLGLGELEGLSGVELVARIADHLSEAAELIDAELMKGALRDTLLEAAELGDDSGIEDVEGGLQAFVSTEGVAGLIEMFLSKYVFVAVWANLEAYAQSRSPDEQSMEAFMSAVEGVCESSVRTEVEAARTQGTFDNLDWFGRDGSRVGRQILRDIEARLKALGQL